MLYIDKEFDKEKAYIKSDGLFSSFSTGNSELDVKLKAEIQICLLVSEEPTDKNIENFDKLSKLIIKVLEKYNSSSKEFNGTIEFLTDLYENKEKLCTSPVWKLLAADVIFALYTATIPESGLLLTNQHIKQCLKWAEAIIHFSKLDNKQELKSKIVACDWIAGIYKRRARSEAEKDNINVDSKHSLQQKSLFYYEKMVEMAINSKFSDFSVISHALSRIIAVRHEFLPKDATLENPESKKLIKSLEQSIAFHGNVPDDKKTQTKYVGPKHLLLELDVVCGKKTGIEIIVEEEKLDKEEPPNVIWNLQEKEQARRAYAEVMFLLGKLYTTTSKVAGKKPDYHKAVVWLDKAKSTRYVTNSEIDELLKREEIINARKEVEASLKETIDKTHQNLLDLTNNYLSKKDISSKKREIFAALKNTLINPSEASKANRIEAFKEQLNSTDKKMLFAHRTETWKRYVYNVFSFLAIVPAIVRARDSYAKYKSLQFWKPESRKAVECAQESILQLDFVK